MLTRIKKKYIYISTLYEDYLINLYESCLRVEKEISITDRTGPTSLSFFSPLLSFSSRLAYESWFHFFPHLYKYGRWPLEYSNSLTIPYIKFVRFTLIHYYVRFFSAFSFAFSFHIFSFIPSVVTQLYYYNSNEKMYYIIFVTIYDYYYLF